MVAEVCSLFRIVPDRTNRLVSRLRRRGALGGHALAGIPYGESLTYAGITALCPSKRQVAKWRFGRSPGRARLCPSLFRAPDRTGPRPTEGIRDRFSGALHRNGIIDVAAADPADGRGPIRTDRGRSVASRWAGGRVRTVSELRTRAGRDRTGCPRTGPGRRAVTPQIGASRQVFTAPRSRHCGSYRVCRRACEPVRWPG